jgi:hypothetical protein
MLFGVSAGSCSPTSRDYCVFVGLAILFWIKVPGTRGLLDRETGRSLTNWLTEIADFQEKVTRVALLVLLAVART